MWDAVNLQQLVGCDRSWMVKIASKFGKITDTDIWLIACLYSGVISKYRITKSSQNTQNPILTYTSTILGFHKDAFQNYKQFIQCQINILGLKGITFINKSLLFLSNRGTNINSSVPIFLAL